jgi:hypothetical protein
LSIAIRFILVASVVLCGVCQASPYLNLVLPNSWGTIDSAYWNTNSNGSGTGGFRPFLQLGDNNDAGYSETGYNSNYQTTSQDNPEVGNPANFNHLVQWPFISMLNGPTVGGTVRSGWWVELQLDINENSGGAGGTNDAYLSIDDLEVWLSDRADLGNPADASLYYSNWGNDTTYPALYGKTDKIYDTSAFGWIATDYRSYSSGSGICDIQVLLPWQRFANWIAANNVQNPYIYVKTTLGATTETFDPDGAGAMPAVTNWTTSDGFEEWGFRDPYTYKDIPEPGTMALFGLGLLGMAAARRRRAA